MLAEAGTCDAQPLVETLWGNVAHEFNAASGKSGHSFSTMAWVKCSSGSGWANIWHLSESNANYPRNPAIWLNNDGRYIHACFTNAD
jgi:hypothetical protein